MTTPPSPQTPPSAQTIICPAADELERFITDGAVDPTLRAHIDRCDNCRAHERAVRENLQFIDGFVRELGPAGLAPPPPRPLPTSVAGLTGYQFIREIARGGQGVVYEAIQLETRRRVAVKMIDPSDLVGPDATPRSRGRRRIEREAEIAAGLRHPNIVTVYDSAALPDGRYALAMEYLDGLTLDLWARTLDEATPAERGAQREAVRTKLRTLAAVCDAVQHAHQNGVIHRDLKPANVLVDKDGVPRVVDFGIARRTATGAGAAVGITRAGEFAGTLAYASPEQVSGDADSVDTRADVYALGLILYELLAGRRPYETHGSLTGAIANITTAEPAPLNGAVQPGNQTAGDELETIVRKALAKDRADRYQTAGELKADIDNWLAGRAINAKRESAIYILRKTAARYRVAAAVIVGFLILLTVFAAAMASSARRLTRERSLLATSLSTSTVERGRLLSLNGANARSESMIWPELLRTGANPYDPDLGFTSSPEVTQAAWALYEVYSRHPCVLNVPALPGAQALAFGHDAPDTIRLARPDGAWEVRRLSDGSLVSSGAAAFPEISQRAAGILLDRDQKHTLWTDPNDPAGPTLHILDLETRNERLVRDPSLRQVAWSTLADHGRRLLTITGASGECELRLWQVDPFKPVAVLSSATMEQCRAFPFSHPSRGEIILGGISNRLQAWSAADGSLVDTWQVSPEQWAQALRPVINVVQMSPDHHQLAAGLGNQLLLFDADDPSKPPRSRLAHRGFVNFVGFSADSTTLLTSGHERSFKAWDLASATPLGNFEQSVPTSGVPAISDDGSMAAVNNTQDSVRVWETRPRRWLSRLREPTNSVHFVRFSPDGALVAAASSDGVARVWRTADHTLVWDSFTHTDPEQVADNSMPSLTALSFSPDGRMLAYAAGGGDVFVCDAATGRNRRLLARGPIRVTWIGYSPDGQSIALAASDSRVHFYNAQTGAETATLASAADTGGSGHTLRVVEAAFNRNGSEMITAGADGVAIVWNLASRTPRLRLEGHVAGVRAVAMSPDGKQIATGSDDWTIRLWDAQTGRCIRIIRDVKQHVFGLAYHPKGNLLFSCCRDSDLQVWDVRTGREVATLEGHDGLVLSLAVSPDGNTLASGSQDRTVGLWDLRYYQRHVRGNAEIWRSGHGQLPDPEDRPAQP